MDYEKIYKEVFKQENYNKNDLREHVFEKVLNRLSPQTKSLIDIGSGRGRFLLEAYERIPDIEITSLDLDNFHDIELLSYVGASLANFNFIKADLSRKDQREELLSLYEDNKFDMLTCLDCLEHLDKSFIDDVLFLFSKISKKSIFTIANHSDKWGGVELHLIQEGPEYWTKLISEHSTITEAIRSHARCALFSCSNE